jgi:NADH-quinone oxidoreductase subunit E
MSPSNEVSQRAGSALVDPAKQAMLLAALYITQEQQGYLTREAVERVAKRLGLSTSQVYGTASFYTLFRTEPVGRYVIQVCDGLSCYLAGGADQVSDYVSTKLGIKPGETSKDGRFTLQEVQCLASCGTAPAMRVNDILHENLTPATIDAVLERLMGEV